MEYVGNHSAFRGTFRVSRMQSLPSRNLYYDEVADCGVSTNSTDLRALIVTAQSLHFVDFGNGLPGICAECYDLHFCVVPEPKIIVANSNP
jgi:hypothetical protein